MKKEIIQVFKIIIMAVALVLSINYVYAAWQGPINNPPLDNTDTPLNTGDNSQSKLGQLILNTDINNPVYDMGLGVWGKVGIGTIVPDTVLHLKTINNTPLLKLTSDASSEIIFDPQGIPANKFQLSAYGGKFSISSFFTGASIDVVTVEGDTGRVGIGVNNPDTVLHLKTTNNTPLLKLTSDASSEIIFDPQGIPKDEIMLKADNGSLRVEEFSTGTNRTVMRLYGPDQNITIGSNSKPDYKLDIYGGDINTRNGGYRDAGTCVAGTCASDRRLKENIEPLSNSLEKITQLEPVSFNFIDPKFGPGTQYGLIAQDVEKVFPELVSNTKEGYKSIRYGLQIQMEMLQAIKELKKENEKLKTRVEALEKLH